MSTPQHCPGCGNRCSLSSPSCSTGEAYLRAFRQARRKKQTSAPAEPAPPAPVPAAPQGAGHAPAPSVQAAEPSPRRPSSGSAPKTRKPASAAAPSGRRASARSRSGPELAQADYLALPLEDRLALQLHRLARLLARNQPREKSGQGRILALLAQRGAVTQRELLALTGIRSSSLSELLGKLEGARLIARAPCPTDRRTTLVSLTEQGRRKLAQDGSAPRPDPFQRLDAAQRAELLALLEALNGG